MTVPPWAWSALRWAAPRAGRWILEKGLARYRRIRERGEDPFSRLYRMENRLTDLSRRADEPARLQASLHALERAERHLEWITGLSVALSSGALALVWLSR